MNLKEEWNAMQQEMEQENRYNVDLNMHSQNLYDRLLKGLSIKRYWCIAIAILFLAFSFLVDEGLLRHICSALFFANLFTAYQLKHQVKQLSLPPDYSAPLKNVLAENLLKFERILRVEKIFGIIMAPLVGPFTVLVLNLSKHNSLKATLEQSPYFFYYLFGSMLLAIPIYFLGMYMTKVAFGTDLKALRKNIKELEGDDVGFLRIPL